ncbi:hypothetical protein EGR_03790 [Echinococcus granulosus]|uniref:Uncharacterized protein n=1 Tax=Echinococcus granulosus TaxID=6210 RepID=W6V500_ECHGR|nr:hypothetical protein EGR_03790 [Echinococcus granulosus]EUB61304.1 hypothetical protein EGR_03790 [Echinococcus granulosus]
MNSRKTIPHNGMKKLRTKKAKSRLHLFYYHKNSLQFGNSNEADIKCATSLHLKLQLIAVFLSPLIGQKIKNLSLYSEIVLKFCSKMSNLFNGKKKSWMTGPACRQVVATTRNSEESDLVEGAFYKKASSPCAQFRINN